MNKILFTLTIIAFTHTSSAQQYDRERYCGTDTIIINRSTRMLNMQKPYKALECTQVSPLGIRVDIGAEGHNYNGKTKEWLGNPVGGLLGLTVAYKNFNIGARVKLATVHTGADIISGSDTVLKNSSLNPIRIDYFISYSCNLKYNLSVEPYLGWTKNEFYVFNDEDKDKSHYIQSSNGLTGGISLNKYFRVAEFQFISIFANAGYSFASFKRTSSQLDPNAFEWAFGLSYKGFHRQRFYQHIKQHSQQANSSY